MDKPIILTQGLSPMRSQHFEPYLPSVFDGNLTLLEKVDKVIVYLNQIGRLSNGVLDQWNQVMEWVMADGLYDVINQKIETMSTDGTLANIINIDMLNLKADKTYVDNQLLLKASEAELTSTITTLTNLVNDTVTSLTASVNQSIKDGTSFPKIKESFAPSDTTVDIANMTFRPVKQIRPMIDDDYILINDVNFMANLIEAVPSDYTLEGGTNFFEQVVLTDGGATFSLNDSAFTINHDAANVTSDERFLVLRQGLPAPHFFVKASINQMVRNNPTGGIYNDDLNPQIILYKDANNHIQVSLNVNQTRIEIFSKINGATNSVPSTFGIDPTMLPCEIGLMFMAGTVVAFYRSQNNPWHWEAVSEIQNVDFTDLTQLTQWRIGIGAYTEADTYAKFNNFKVMLSPQFGYRDHTPICYEDGSPLIVDHKMYFTVTLGGERMKTSGLGIISYDYNNHEVKLVSYLYDNPDFAVNRVFADGQAQVFYDRRTDLWHCLFSGFGVNQFGLNPLTSTYHGTTKANVLRGVHYVKTTKLALPTSDYNNVYDLFCIYDYDVNKWRIVHNSNYGTVILSESTDFITWTSIATTSADEGSKIIRLNNKYYITTTDHRSSAIYDYPTLANKKAIQTTINSGHKSPHAGIFALPFDKTVYRYLTMDGARAFAREYSWGGTWIYEADTTKDGYESDYVIQNGYGSPV